MENKVRIQDDLYMAINGDWISKAKIPDDKPVVGGFQTLADDVEKTLIKDFKAMADRKKEIPNGEIKNGVIIFKKALDTKKRNKDGIKPLLPRLKYLQKIKDIDDFNSKLVYLALNNYSLPFNFGVDVDMKNTKKHALIISGLPIILPDTTTYNNEATKNQLLSLWSKMVAQLLALTPLSEDEQKEYLKDALNFDDRISKIVKSQEEWADYVANYNPYDFKDVTTKLNTVAFKNMVKEIFEKTPKKVIVFEPRFLDNFSKLFNETTFKEYLHWAYINEILGSTSYLSTKIKTLGNYYRRALYGIKKETSPIKSAYRLALGPAGFFSEPAGVYYGKTYFGKKAKEDVVKIVKEIIETYKKRLSTNTTLSKATIDRAILKLSKIEIKMGYPDKASKLYRKYKFNPRSSLFAIVSELNAIKTKYYLSKLYEDVDRKEWLMPAHLVNACYNPTSNDITFPAAILQKPFYSLKQSLADNLGGIGAVIGHEISHAFDNNGSKCDENGNLNNWWTEEDFKKFEMMTNKMIQEFDGIELAGGKVNGKLIVSENIADNGGVAVALDILTHSSSNPDYQEFFKNFARIWCMKAKKEYTRLLLTTDVHAPAILRANIQVRNFPEWYKAFDVKPTDKMYLPIEKRVIIW